MPIKTLLAQLQAVSGLHLTEAAVKRAVAQRMRQLPHAASAAYLARAVLRQEEIAALLELLVVPETWFFRDPAVFPALVRFVRERLARPMRTGLPRPPVRILSLPCATGEEAYTIAMALLDAGITPSSFAIDAMDISRDAIERARRGVYQRNSFRSPQLDFRDRWFSQCDAGHVLHQRIRDMVRFTSGNLFDAAPEAATYDVIFCRNLLIYFDEETQQRASDRLASLLADDGMLITGYAELAVCGKRLFSMRPYADAFVLRKRQPHTEDAVELQMPRRRRPQTAPVPQAFLRPPPAVQLQRCVAKPPAVQTRHSLEKPSAAMLSPANEAGAAQSVPSSASTELQSMLAQARCLADGGDVDAATASVSACLRAFPDSAEAHFLSALISERRAHTKTIEESLRRTVYLDPQHYEALCRLALLAESAGDAARAASFRQRAARVFKRRGAESKN